MIYGVGHTLRLAVPCPVSPTSSFEWTKDGQPLVDDGRVAGTLERGLTIEGLTEADSGEYTCTYDDGSKTPTVFSATVLVSAELPATGWLGFVAMALGLSGAALVRQRRRLRT
ncbi:MAG: hypothetical protein GWP08_19405 [Nitrospiraceae bacterium]|nr:hypothetical protein [Nitrospiraceae bacterium]